MASMSFTLTIGATTGTQTVNPTDARALEFLDDLRFIHYPEIDDGAGGTRPMTRVEAGTRYAQDLIAGQVEFARGLKQRRLDAEVAASDNLLGQA